MKKGISFYYGFKVSPEERAQKIGEAKFDCVITSNDKNFKKQNGSIRRQLRLFKKNNIGLSSLHMQYKTEELPYFWQESKIGDKIEKTLKQDVKTAKKFGFSCVVVHLKGEPNKIGYDRLNRVLKLCEKLKLPLAIENIDDQNCFLRTFENVKSDYMLFCYDSGHNHCFDPEFDYLTQFGDKLIALHLHDNLGPNVTKEQLVELNVKKNDCVVDLHTLNKYGNIDWDLIAQKLAKVPREINLDYEMLLYARKNETQEEVLNEVNTQACELEKMIEKYKK